MKRLLKIASMAAMLLAMVGAVVQAGRTTAQTGRKVSGVVVSAATQRPIANAAVQYEENGVAQTAATDSKGRFEFPSGALGVVTVTVKGFGTARRRWPPASGYDLSIALTPPVTVQGTLVDGMTVRPMAGVVTALVQHPGNVVSTTALVDDGTFRFDDLPAGPGVLLSHEHGYAPAISRFTTTAGDWRDVHVRLSPDAEVTGRVLNASATPAAGADLVVTYAETLLGGGMFAGLVGGATATGSDGTFALEGLVPNTPVTIHAQIGDRRTNRATITIGAGMTHEGLVLRLR